MPRRQKKHQTAEAILKDIDKSQRKVLKLRSEAGELYAVAGFHLMAEDRANYTRTMDEADALLRKAQRIQETRLKKLQNTLAAFQTGTLFGDA